MPYRSDPYGNLASSINDLATNLIRVRGQNLSQTLGEAQLGMEARRLGEAERQHNIASWGTETSQTGIPTLQMRSVQTAEEQNRQKMAASPHLAVFNPSDIDRVKIATAQKYGKTALETITPVFDMGAQIAAVPNSTRKDAYVAIKSAWPELRQAILEKVNKVDVTKLDPEEQKKFFAYKDAITYDETGENHLDKGFFANTKAGMDSEATANRVKISMDEIKANIALKAASGETLSDEEKMILGSERKADPFTVFRAEQKAAGESDTDIVKEWKRMSAEETRSGKIELGSGFDKLLQKQMGDFYRDEIKAVNDQLKNVPDIPTMKDQRDELIRRKDEAQEGLRSVLGMKKTGKAGTDKKDSFGYTVGQTTAKGGKTYKYIGNNKWQAQ